MADKNADITIPSNKEDRKKIYEGIKEASNCMLRREAERDAISSIRDDIHENYDIPKPHITRLIKTYHAQNYGEERAKDEAFEELYEAIVNSKGSNNNP